MNINNIIEDEIISIEEYEIIDTIDIEVESKNRLFFANDILTHNSGWDTSDLSISNVSESGALLHTVDGLFGIVVNPEMKAKGECYIKYLADRVSGMENTRKRFTFQRKYSRIEEDMEAQIEDLEFMFNTLLRGNGKTDYRGAPKGHSQIDAKISSQANEQGIVESPITNSINKNAELFTA
jgi:hypothetical protein